MSRWKRSAFDLLDGSQLVFIEWPERVPDLRDDVTWRVVLEERDIEEREITLQPTRSQSLARLRKRQS